MLLRDLDWQPREKQHYWDSAAICLKSGDTLFLERPVREAICRTQSKFSVIFVPGHHAVETLNRVGLPDNEWKGHECSTEFEAQAVLDHYLAKYGAADG